MENNDLKSKDQRLATNAESPEEDWNSWAEPKIDYPVRPWVRYWARNMDYYLAAFPIGLLLGIVAPFVVGLPDVVLGVLILPICAIFEAVLLSTWGYTPGKWLLKVKVRTEAGERLSFSEALKRSFSVLYHGLGLGIPVVVLITNVRSFEQLKDAGTTKWDQAGGLVVTHDRIGMLRIIGGACVYAAFSYFTFVGI